MAAGNDSVGIDGITPFGLGIGKAEGKRTAHGAKCIAHGSCEMMNSAQIRCLESTPCR